MATLNAVADSLGLSERALRLRIDALGGVIDPHIRRERYNALELTGDAVALLRRLETLRRTGSLTMRQAAAKLHAELDSNGNGSLAETTADCASNGEVEALRDALRDARAERDYWRKHAEHLATMLEEAQRPALAVRTSWWARLLGR